MMEKNEHVKDDPGGPATHLNLRFLGDGVLPEEITRILGVNPTRCWRRGEKYITKGGQELRRYRSLWSYRTDELLKSKNVERHALQLIEIFEGKLDKLKALAKKKDLRATVVIWWQSPAGHGNFSIESSIVARLSALAPEIELFFV